MTDMDWATMAVLWWLRSRDLEAIQRAAESAADVVQDLRQSLPSWWLPAAGLFLGGTAGRRRIEQMGKADWLRALDQALREEPAKALLLWAHLDWYLDQMDRLKAAVLQAV